MRDGPAEPLIPRERPILKVLVIRADWDRGDNPMLLMRHPHAFAVIDLLAVPIYAEMGWRVVGLDPESELAWQVWRAQHPEAA